MTVDQQGDEVRYTSRRTGTPRGTGPKPGYDMRIRIGTRLDDTDRSGLVDWCTGRWRAWTHHLGRLLRCPVEHEPWPLHHADLIDLTQTLTTVAGLPPPTSAPLVHYSPGVDVRLSRPQPLLAPPGRSGPQCVDTPGT
jgi:uncharacterized protein YqjF (DUF2071 family)